MSGKRLRVENECVGRPGGAFAGVGEIGRNEKGTEHGGEDREVQEQPATTANLSLDDSEARMGQDGESSKRVEA